MIKDSHGYKGTLGLLAQWTQHLEDFLREKVCEPGKEKEYNDHKQSIETEIYLIQQELKEFEDLVNGKTELPSLECVGEIPDLLIKWRLAKGWSQEELAEKSGVDFILVVAYERYDYENARFADILKIAGVLRYEEPERPISELEDALKEPAS